MTPMARWHWLLFVGVGAMIVALAALIHSPSVEAKPDKGCATGDDLVLALDTDEAACAAGAIQCTDDGSGHGIEAASAANHNPVMIVALVTDNGAPVTGLTASNFFLSTRTVAAGGPAVLLCPAGGTGCASPSNLFKGADDGTYIMFAHPGPAGVNWRAGSYFPTVELVMPDGRRRRVLARIDIPPAP